MKSILGISAFYHDSAAALIIDGKIIAAAQEERFSRKKHDARYPFHAVEYVLRESKLNLNQIDHIVFFEKPFLKFERLLETYMAFAPKGFKSFSLSMPIWLREKLFQKKFLYDKLKQHDEKFKDIKKINFSEHHYSHAASAFYPSPFKEAIILTLDGVGEWATTTVAVGNKNKLLSKYKEESGGLSGLPLNDPSNETIKKFYKKLEGSIPIIGAGGVNNGKSAFDKIKSGASLLQLYTALVYEGPYVASKINKELSDIIEENGYKNISEIIGLDCK